LPQAFEERFDWRISATILHPILRESRSKWNATSVSKDGELHYSLES